MGTDPIRKQETTGADQHDQQLLRRADPPSGTIVQPSAGEQAASAGIYMGTEPLELEGQTVRKVSPSPTCSLSKALQDAMTAQAPRDKQ